MIRWWSVKTFLMSFSRSDWKFLDFSSWSANCCNSSAMMVFKAMLGPEIDWLEPSIRNSNLLPVKAMGEVRFRSVLSWGMGGMASTPIWRVRLPASLNSVPRMMDCTMASSSSPRKMERTAGGASEAPRR